MGRSEARFRVATGTAGNLLGLALKGTAEPAVMVTTGWRRPVEFIIPEFFTASAGSAAECAPEVAAGEASAAFEALGAGAGGGPSADAERCSMM
jgi:hypothetical protein